MGMISHSIEIDAPLRDVYHQWTRFEEFPLFMEGVEEVRREGEKRLFWRVKIGGMVKEWEAEVTDLVLNQRIAWQSVDGSPNAGIVTFDELDANLTRVTATIEYETDGLLEKTGDVLGIPSARVQGDLKRFRDHIEKAKEKVERVDEPSRQPAEADTPYFGSLPTTQPGKGFQAQPTPDRPYGLEVDEPLIEKEEK
jgi:uncharacterized membrane protein